MRGYNAPVVESKSVKKVLFTVTQKELSRVSTILSKIVLKKTYCPTLNQIMIQCKDGKVSMIANDSENQIKVFLNVLIYIIKSLDKKSNINFSYCDENNKIIIESRDGILHELNSFCHLDFPIIEFNEKIKFNLDSAILKDHLDKTMYAMAKNDVRRYLNGMLWESCDGNFKTVSTDGHRLALHKTKLNDLPDFKMILTEKMVKFINAIIPKKSLNIACSVGVLSYEKVGRNCQITNYLMYSCNDIELIVRLIGERFPAYERIIPFPDWACTGKISIKTKELLDALAEAVGASSVKYHGGFFSFSKNGKLNIFAEQHASLDMPENIDVDALENGGIKTKVGNITINQNPELGGGIYQTKEYSNDLDFLSNECFEVKLEFNLKYLIDALNSIDSENVTICYGQYFDSTKIILFGDDEFNFDIENSNHLNVCKGM